MAVMRIQLYLYQYLYLYSTLYRRISTGLFWTSESNFYNLHFDSLSVGLTALSLQISFNLLNHCLYLFLS
jgi:hypothetical protein